MKKVLALTMALALVAASFAGCGNSSSGTSTTAAATTAAAEGTGTVKIGMSGPLTGGASAYGLAVKAGMEVAVEEINAKGGLQIEFNAQDDEADGEKAVSAYNVLKDWGMQISLGSVTSKPCEVTAGDTFAELNRYLHMRFYKQTEGKDGKKKEYTTYAYTTAYPNKDYMGLVVSNLEFYARGWKEEKETGKICLTSLSMQMTVAKPDGTPVYTQTAVIPLPGAPEFQ